MNKSHAALVLTACLLLTGTRCWSQQVLFHTDSWHTRPINTALLDLGIDVRGVTDEQEFLDQLRLRRWDLVIVHLRDPYAAPYRADILAALHEHVDNGGALMFSVAQLDEMPDFWPLLGIEGARDLELPLSDIIPPGGFIPVERRHPAFRNGFLQVGDELFGPDYGDSLEPGQGSIVLASFADSADPAIVLAHSGRVIVNGQEWDN